MKSADKRKLLDKIRKCLALATSSNPNEAAIALRQAQSLMREHGIDQTDVTASQASESAAKSQASRTPTAYETHLAMIIGAAFCCDVIFHRTGLSPGHWLFVGVGPKSEIATYAFQVLHRKLGKARRHFISGLHKNCKRQTKIKRADAFCKGWVVGVEQTVIIFARSPEDDRTIAAYREKRFGTQLEMTKARGGKGSNVWDTMEGFLAGKREQIHHGVGGVSGQQGLLAG